MHHATFHQNLCLTSAKSFLAFITCPSPLHYKFPSEPQELLTKTHATFEWKGVKGVLVFIVVVKIHFLHVKAESPFSWVEALVYTSRSRTRKIRKLQTCFRFFVIKSTSNKSHKTFSEQFYTNNFFLVPLKIMWKKNLKEKCQHFVESFLSSSY